MWTRTPFPSLVVALALLAAQPARADAPAPDDRAQIRERFRLGMEKYTQGQYREAIGYWDAIYRELGPREGYRLSFNLARAYEKFSDFTLAAERYESFLTEIEVRRQEGKDVEPIIEKEEKEARERLDQLRASKGRIRVVPSKQPAEAKIDETDRRLAGFIAYVEPGPHTVVFVRGGTTLEKRDVNVKAGETIDVLAPAPPPEAPPPPRIQTRREIAPPFTPAVVYTAGAVTVVSILVPVLFYTHALSVKRDHDQMLDSNGAVAAKDLEHARSLEDDYLTARTTAYAMMAVPLSLAAITGALAAWYFLGTKEREVVVRPAQAGLGLGAEARF
jgi:hypothetical protein